MKNTLLGLGIWLALVAALVSLFLTGCSSPPEAITYESVTYETPAAEPPDASSDAPPIDLPDAFGGCTVDFDNYTQLGRKQIGGGWSYVANLSTQDPKTGNLNANFGGGDSCQYYTVQFGITYPQPVAGAKVQARAEAMINWKVNGNIITRRVTIGNGVSVSGAGQAVDVIVSDVTPSGAANAGQAYTVSVHVVPGTRPSASYPPTLFAFGSTGVAAGTNFTQQIPQDAGVTSIFIVWEDPASDPPPIGQMTVSFQDPAGNTIMSSDLAFILDRFIPIPPGTTQIKFANSLGSPNNIVSAFWGIDG